MDCFFRGRIDLSKVKIVPDPQFRHSHKADTAAETSGYTVTTNPELFARMTSQQRQKSIAHELAHVLQHQSDYERKKPESDLDKRFYRYGGVKRLERVFGSGGSIKDLTSEEQAHAMTVYYELLAAQSRGEHIPAKILGPYELLYRQLLAVQGDRVLRGHLPSRCPTRQSRPERH